MKEKQRTESCRGPPKGPFLPRQILQRKEEYDGNLSHAHRQPAAAVFAHLHPQAEVPDGPRLHPPRGHRPGHLPVPCPLGGRGGIQAPYGGGARLSWGAGGAVQLSPSPQTQAKREPAFQPTPENCQRFRQWLAQRWANEPDALPIQRAAQLLGRNPQTLHRWIKEGRLQAVQVGRNQLCSKEELFTFLATPERVLGCRELVGEFLVETQ